MSLFEKGHTACAGCPLALLCQHLTKTAGPKTIISNATSCSEIISTSYPTTSWGIPYIHTAFECSAATASGIEAALKKKGKEANVIVLAGDGGTYDIGLQALSGMIDRGHNVLYVCYDNECYANTGLQRSSATPYAAWTTTSPAGKESIGNKTFKKPIAEMMAAQGAAYVATASIGYYQDLNQKIKKALQIKGPKFLLVQAPCPVSWRFPPSDTVNIAKLAVETGLWVLYEIVDGKLKITHQPQMTPVKEYLKAQKRFKHITEKEIQTIQEKVKQDWDKYKELQKVKL